MILLIDFDSIIYKSVYKVVSINEMRNALLTMSKADAKRWLMQEVYDQAINRCENEILKIQQHIESIFFDEITGVELFITTCKKSFRKELSNEYKAKRKKNNYVWMVREHYMFNDAFHSDTLEADDLIAIRAKELGKDNCIIVSIDKDLRQIGGWLWSYQKVAETDMNGEIVLNEYEQKQYVYKYNEVEFITDEEANNHFWLQMLMGDSGDGISGLKKVGTVTANKILKDCSKPFIKVAREYIKREQKNDFWINYKLLKLGYA